MKFKPFLRSALLAMLAGASFTATSVQAQSQTVKVGYFSQLHDAALLSLQDRLGSKYKLEYVKFQRYADAGIALTRGDIQVSSLGFASLISDAARGGSQKITFVAGLARGAINLVCRKEVKVEQWADLKGKTIGVVSGFPEIFLDDALLKHGQSANDLNKVNFAVAGPPVLQALKDGTVQCVSVFEPFAATAVAEGYANYAKTDLADNSFLGLNNGVAVNVEFLKNNAAFVQEAVNGIVDATAQFKRNKQSWIDLMVQSQGFSPAIVKLGVEHVTLDSAIYRDQAWTLAGGMQKIGLTKPIAARETLNAYFDTRFLEAAQARAGK